MPTWNYVVVHAYGHLKVIEDGEWLQYTVNVKTKGIYPIVFSVASDSGTGKITLSRDGTELAKDIAVPNTGDDQNWQMADADVSLNPGVNHLIVHADKGGFNFKSIQFILKK